MIGVTLIIFFIHYTHFSTFTGTQTSNLQVTSCQFQTLGVSYFAAQANIPDLAHHNVLQVSKVVTVDKNSYQEIQTFGEKPAHCPQKSREYRPEHRPCCPVRGASIFAFTLLSNCRVEKVSTKTHHFESFYTKL